MFHNTNYKIFSLGLLILLSSCVSTLPNKEYALAESALKSAKKFLADQSSPKNYFQAISFYNQGRNFYNQKNYEKARESFLLSVRYAEKAELKSRVKHLKEP